MMYKIISVFTVGYLTTWSFLEVWTTDTGFWMWRKKVVTKYWPSHATNLYIQLKPVCWRMTGNERDIWPGHCVLIVHIHQSQTEPTLFFCVQGDDAHPLWWCGSSGGQLWRRVLGGGERSGLAGFTSWYLDLRDQHFELHPLHEARSPEWCVQGATLLDLYNSSLFVSLNTQKVHSGNKYCIASYMLKESDKI